MNSEDTILNQQQNDNEETLPNNNQSTSKEQPAKKDSSWKHVTIGGISGILLGAASTFSPALPVPPMTVTLPATAASQQQAMALLPFLQTHTSL